MVYAYLEESCIRYEEGDLLGWALAYCSLGHLVVVVVYLTMAVLVRDIQVREDSRELDGVS